MIKYKIFKVPVYNLGMEESWWWEYQLWEVDSRTEEKVSSRPMLESRDLEKVQTLLIESKKMERSEETR